MKKLSHAYIISSPSAEAAGARALKLAAELLCSAEGKRPCGLCRDCRKLHAGVHPDLGYIRRLVDSEGRLKHIISVNQIRALRRDAAVLPNEARGKVYIIEEAERMNDEAQNAALKLFEEPPENVSFILLTQNPDALLETVKSRCVSLVCNEEDSGDAELSALASEYLRLCESGRPWELFEWCAANEGMDSRRLPDFLELVKRRLVESLRYGGDRNKMLLIELCDRCLKYQSVNTNVKHIFGLLAVCVPQAKETRKKVD